MGGRDEPRARGAAVSGQCPGCQAVHPLGSLRLERFPAGLSSLPVSQNHSETAGHASA